MIKIKIKETGEREELTIIDPKSGLSWVSDLMGNHDAKMVYDEDEGIYIMEKEEFDWWGDLIKRYQKADNFKHQVFEDCEDAEKFYNAIAEAGDGDLEDYPERLTQYVIDFIDYDFLLDNGDKMESAFEGTCFLYEYWGIEFVVLSDNSVIPIEEDNAKNDESVIFSY